MIAAIVVSAGQGVRFGGDVPKQFVRLKDRPLLAYSLLKLEAHAAVGTIVIVSSPAWRSYVEEEIIDRHALRKVAAVVTGGQERQDSVAAGLAAVPAAYDLVAVHDAVRPFFSPQLLDRVIAGCRGVDACIPAIRPRDTVKRVEGNLVARTLSRDALRLAQTPQIFRPAMLQTAFEFARAHRLAGTDEAALVEAAGGTVAWVEGEEQNLKITTPLDFKIAEILGEGTP